GPPSTQIFTLSLHGRSSDLETSSNGCLPVTKRPQLRTVVLYVTVSALWIWFSDHALNALVEGRAELAFLQSIKGWFFVLGTGARSEEHTSELQSREKLVCRL